MAIGSARMLNIRLPINFYSPYKSLSISEFWRRWHITLGRFLKDHVYIPLGGARHNALWNIFITFLLGGIWHGAGWTFIAWGFLHGVGVMAHRVWVGAGMRMPKAFAWVLTFGFLNVTWVFYREENISDALQMIKTMFSASMFALPKSMRGIMEPAGIYVNYTDLHLALNMEPQSIIYVAAGLLLLAWPHNAIYMMEHFQPRLRTAIFLLCVTVISVTFINRASEFLYFNF